MSSKLELPRTRPHRWRPTFVSTWLVLACSLLLVGLLMVAGKSTNGLHRLGVYASPKSASSASLLPDARLAQARRVAEQAGRAEPEWSVEYEHGWPMTCLHRLKCYGAGWDPIESRLAQPLIDFSGGQWPHRGVSWTVYDAWPLSGDQWRFHALALAVDALVAAVLVGGLVGMWEWRLRRRGSLWRVSLSDYAVIVMAVSVVMGWRQSSIAAHRAEEKALGRLEPPHSERQKNLITPYCGPDWLSRLLGSVAWCPRSCFRVRALLIYGDTVQSDDWSMLSHLDELRSITFIGGEPPHQSLDKLKAAFPHVEVRIDLDPRRDLRREDLYLWKSPGATQG